MAIDKINIQEKADNPNKKALLARLGVPQDESLSAQETNKLVGKTNELVEKTNELNQKFDAYKPVNAFNFKGNVSTYANLPTTGLIKDDAYGVIADGLVYIYNGSSFPTSGNGLNLGLKPTSDSKVAAGNELAVSGGEVFEVTKDLYKEVDLKCFFELGRINQDTGKTETFARRIRTSFFQNKVYGYKVTIDNNYAFKVFHYNEDGIYQGTPTLDWVQSIESDFQGFIKLVVVNYPNANVGTITPETITGIKLLVKESSIIDLNNKFQDTSIKILDQGSIASATGLIYELEPTLYTRIRTGYIKTDGYKVSVDEGFLLRTYHYNEDGIYQGTPMDVIAQSFESSFNGFIRIVIFRDDDSAINPSVDVGLMINTYFTPSINVSKDFIKNRYFIRPNLEIVAHRAAFKNFDVPEDTVHAVRTASALGIRAIECDTMRTLDGKYIIMHDETINRTMRNASDYSVISTQVVVSENNLSYLKDNYVLQSTNPAYRTKVSTVQEYALECRNQGIFPFFDFKQTNLDVYDVIDDVIEILGDNWCCFSTSKSVLRYTRSKSNNILCMYSNSSSTSDAMSFLDSIGGWCGFGTSNASLLTKDFVESLKIKGYEIQSGIPSKQNSIAVVDNGVTILLMDERILIDKYDRRIIKTITTSSGLSEFTTTGEVINNKFSLIPTKNITYTHSESIKLGAIEVEVEVVGNVTLNINGSKYADLISSEHKIFKVGVFFFDKIPSFSIIATDISEVSYLNANILKSY